MDYACFRRHFVSNVCDKTPLDTIEQWSDVWIVSKRGDMIGVGYNLTN